MKDDIKNLEDFLADWKKLVRERINNLESRNRVLIEAFARLIAFGVISRETVHKTIDDVYVTFLGKGR